MAARTRRLELGTGVIDMRYENPLCMAEQAAALRVGGVRSRAAGGQQRRRPEDDRWPAGSATLGVTNHARGGDAAVPADPAGRPSNGYLRRSPLL
jgi:hypothetical protein